MDPMKNGLRIVEVFPDVRRDGEKGFACMRCADGSMWWAHQEEVRSGRLPELGRILNIAGRKRKA